MSFISRSSSQCYSSKDPLWPYSSCEGPLWTTRTERCSRSQQLNSGRSSNFRPGMRFPSYLYDFSASKEGFFVRTCEVICDPEKLGLQCHFSWFILRPDLGVGFEACFLRNCPYKCPLPWGWPVCFGSGMTSPTTVSYPQWIFEKLWTTENQATKRESDRLTTSRLCFCYRSLPRFSMFFVDAASEVNFSEARSSRSSRSLKNWEP